MKLLTKKSLGRQKQLTSMIMKKKYSVEIKKKSQELANEANAYWWKKMYLARLRNPGVTSS